MFRDLVLLQMPIQVTEFNYKGNFIFNDDESTR